MNKKQIQSLLCGQWLSKIKMVTSIIAHHVYRLVFHPSSHLFPKQDVEEMENMELVYSYLEESIKVQHKIERLVCVGTYRFILQFGECESLTTGCRGAEKLRLFLAGGGNCFCPTENGSSAAD
ncbi:hypothetical protein MG293_003483, partial [Ovis ammon polii]